jgi:hypothetical protein
MYLDGGSKAQYAPDVRQDSTGAGVGATPFFYWLSFLAQAAPRQPGPAWRAKTTQP